MFDAIKKFKYDSVWFGVILGIILPLITFYINYLIHFNGMHWHKLWMIMEEGQMEFPVYTFCLIPNLCGFFVFIWINKDRTSRGFLYTILPYVIFMVWKFSN